MLSGIAAYTPPQINIAGLRLIEYAPTAWIDPDTYANVVDADHMWQGNIDFLQGGWLQAYVLPADRDWRERPQDGRQGPHWRLEVGGTTPRMRPAVSGELQRMRRYRYLLRITDRNDQRWLLGTLEQPLAFSGGAENALRRNAYDLAWQGECTQNAVGWAE